MKYAELKKFISEEMKIEDGKNYQPVMILTLNQKHGEASKEEIIKKLQKYNPSLPPNHFNDCPVFDVLQKHKVVEFDSSKNMYRLLNYDQIDTFFGRKAKITKLCEKKIRNPFGIKLSLETIDDVISEFRDWLETDEAQNHLKTIENEKQEVKDLMKKLAAMDKNSPEFTDEVLYGLLPYFKNSYAKRTSTFPVFRNIKAFLKSYDYTDTDWNNIANMIFNLAYDFQKSPEKLEELIEKFTANKKYNRMIQTGAISPILFCINDKYPLINNRIRQTYKEFSYVLGWNDKISRKLVDYSDSIKKCQKLINELQVDELKNLTVFDVFCYWYDHIRKTEELEEIIEDSDVVGKEIDDVNFEEYLSTVKLEGKKSFEPHSLPDPQRIKIRDIIQNCEKGRWEIPNFQRYFDWKEKDIRDLLESIFRDYYVGSFLLWDIDKEPPLRIEPILGTNPKDAQTLSIILDGQQRMTSIIYAVKAPKISTNRIKRPVYFYVDFGTYIASERENEEFILTLDHQLSDEECFRKLLFPFYELENYEDWIYRFEDFLDKLSIGDSQKLKDMRRIMQKKLGHMYDGFEIPFITLPSSLEIAKVVDIFEQINTKGKTLNVFDLLNAKLSTFDIELKTLWQDSFHNFDQIKEYKSLEKLPIYILQTISLLNHDYYLCSKEDLLNIYENIFESSELVFEEVWEDVSGFVDDAIKKLENLRDGFGVKDRKNLPYAPTIPIIAALLKDIDERDNIADCNKKIDMWYWSSVFGLSYSSSADSQLTTDFREMQKWFENDENVPKIVERVRREYRATINLREIQSTSNAIFRGALSLVALRGAIDFNTDRALENARTNDKHHLFPKAAFKNSRIGTVLNYTWLSGETNRNIVRDKKPSLYIPEFIKKNYGNDVPKFLSVLQSHFISKEAYEFLLKDDYNGFIAEREKSLIKEIGKRIGAEAGEESQTLLSPEKEFENELLVEETFKKCDDYAHLVDRYFRPKGLKWISRYLPKEKVKEVKILTSIDTVNEELRDSFKALRKQMSHDGINCELKVISDNKLKGQIHGRWLITKDDCFSFQSVDTVSRGSYDEIRGGASRPPFDEWWKNSLDIVDDWNKINQNKMVNEKT